MRDFALVALLTIPPAILGIAFDAAINRIENRR